MGIFSRISESMALLNGKVDTIFQGVQEMDVCKSDTLLAINSISAVPQEIAASSEEVTASTQDQLSRIEALSDYAEQLGGMAGELKDSIGRFKVS